VDARPDIACRQLFAAPGYEGWSAMTMSLSTCWINRSVICRNTGFDGPTDGNCCWHATCLLETCLHVCPWHTLARAGGRQKGKEWELDVGCCTCGRSNSCLQWFTAHTCIPVQQAAAKTHALLLSRLCCMCRYGEQMRSISLKYVPTAVLSRQTAGIRGKALIINLPGKPKSIRETFDEVRHSAPCQGRGSCAIQGF
jgi:hypothetical protein